MPGVIEIYYRCPGCGREDSQTVETWYAWDPMRCEDCDLVMEETSREQELGNDDYNKRF